jgi:hypothetical protein
MTVPSNEQKKNDKIKVFCYYGIDDWNGLGGDDELPGD